MDKFRNTLLSCVFSLTVTVLGFSSIYAADDSDSGDDGKIKMSESDAKQRGNTVISHIQNHPTWLGENLADGFSSTRTAYFVTGKNNFSGKIESEGEAYPDVVFTTNIVQDFGDTEDGGIVPVVVGDHEFLLNASRKGAEGDKKSMYGRFGHIVVHSDYIIEHDSLNSQHFQAFRNFLITDDSDDSTLELFIPIPLPVYSKGFGNDIKAFAQSYVKNTLPEAEGLVTYMNISPAIINNKDTVKDRNELDRLHIFASLSRFVKANGRKDAEKVINDIVTKVIGEQSYKESFLKKGYTNRLKHQNPLFDTIKFEDTKTLSDPLVGPKEVDHAYIKATLTVKASKSLDSGSSSSNTSSTTAKSVNHKEGEKTTEKESDDE